MGEGRQEQRITRRQDRSPAIPEVVDYYNAQELLEHELRELAEGGITEETMSRDWQPAQEQKFSPESEALYDELEALITEEWQQFTETLAEDPVLRRYLQMKYKVEGRDLDVLMNAIKRQVEPYQDEAGAFQELDGIRKRLGIEAGLRTFDALRCFKDQIRTLYFFDTIREKIEAGDRVLEAGAGTGILAIAAARAGAKEVEAIEINPVTAVFARRVIARCEERGIIEKGKVKIRLGDAAEYKPKKGEPPFDALVSENLYTGQFHELQVQLNDYLLQFVDGAQDKIIPRAMVNGVELMDLSSELPPLKRFEVAKRTDVVVKDLGIDPRAPKGISDPKAYDVLRFTERQAVGMRNRIVKTIAKDGVIDSVVIFSLIQMSNRKGNFLRRNESEFLGNDLAIMLQNPIAVKKGDRIEIAISYQAGDRPGQAHIRVKRFLPGGIPAEEVGNIRAQGTPPLAAAA